MSLPEMMAIGRSAESPRRSSAAPMRFTCVEHLRIGERAPASLRVALRQEHAFGRGLGPMLQRLAQIVIVGRQHLLGAEMNDSAGTLFEHGIEDAQPHRAQARGGRTRRSRTGHSAGPHCLTKAMARPPIGIKYELSLARN